MNKGEKPIGYWLKEADQSITAKVNQSLNKFNLTRYHWQVLNTVYEKKLVPKDTIAKLLSNFFDDFYLNDIIDDFIQRNWMLQVKHPESNVTMVQMTEEGTKAYNEILSVQQKTRMRLFEGITKEEYETTLKVLKRLIDNAKS